MPVSHKSRSVKKVSKSNKRVNNSKTRKNTRNMGGGLINLVM